MKRLSLVAVIALIVTAATYVALLGGQAAAQDETYLLESEGLTDHQRPPVLFDHSLHEGIIQCQVCHHDFVVFEEEYMGDGSKCSRCHKVEATVEVPVSLREAFHGNCKGCHLNYLNWDRGEAPIMCGQCHKDTPPKAAE